MTVILILFAIVGFAAFGIFIMIQSYGLFLDVFKNERGDSDEPYNSTK